MARQPRSIDGKRKLRMTVMLVLLAVMIPVGALTADPPSGVVVAKDDAYGPFRVKSVQIRDAKGRVKWIGAIQEDFEALAVGDAVTIFQGQKPGEEDSIVAYKRIVREGGGK